MSKKREDLSQDCRALARLYSVLSYDALMFRGRLLLRWLICPSVKTGSLFLHNRIYGVQSAEQTRGARSLGSNKSTTVSRYTGVERCFPEVWGETPTFGELVTNCLL